jgi:formylglycine-generating enzyme
MDMNTKQLLRGITGRNTKAAHPRTTWVASLAVAALIGVVHPALAQPTLGIAPAGNQVLLFWPSNATSHVLQSTTNLVASNWGPVTDAVLVTVNNAINVTVSKTSSAMFFRLYNTNTTVIPAGMALIPAGSFTMGDNLDGESDAAPISVTVSAFYMDTNLVSYSQWQSIYSWATSHGYGFANAGAGKAANHPVRTVDWFDVVKWSNARSQQAGLTPVYYTDAVLTQVYTSGEGTVYVNWTASGYRLPTEAEWEKAARGGLSGQRFPWGNTIDWSHANYNSYWEGGAPYYSFDLAPTSGYDPAFNDGVVPYTSPVGSFPPNGYGLYDMAGNVMEWCWDWFGMRYAGGSDPRGPASGSMRVNRGGYWSLKAPLVRCATRYQSSPSYAFFEFGFRCVIGL